MERQEIEAELNEVERDLADIARRAHIAESNLRSVADGGCLDYEAHGYRVIADDCRNTWEYANKIQNWLRQTREKYRRVAPREGGRGMSVRHYMEYWKLFQHKEISKLREELRRREADWKTLHRLIDGAWSHDAAMAASKWPGDRKEVAE